MYTITHADKEEGEGGREGGRGIEEGTTAGEGLQ